MAWRLEHVLTVKCDVCLEEAKFTSRKSGVNCIWNCEKKGGWKLGIKESKDEKSHGQPNAPAAWKRPGPMTSSDRIIIQEDRKMKFSQLILLMAVRAHGTDAKEVCGDAWSRHDVAYLVGTGVFEDKDYLMLTEKGKRAVTLVMDAFERACGPVEDPGENRTYLDIEDDAATDRMLAVELFKSLRAIIEIGKRDMHNPKYGGVFDSAKRILNIAKDRYKD